MACEGKMCRECTKNCFVIHGQRNDSSPAVTSFFKIMIGENFAKVLYLPPKFARAMSQLAGQKTYLEDSRGRRWKAKFSYHEGSLALVQGWPTFSKEHNVELGDILAFYYVKGSHFVVNIWGPSGCEKLRYSEENGNENKKIRTNRNLAVQDEPCNRIDKNSTTKPGSSTSIILGSSVEPSHVEPIASNSTSNLSCGNGENQLVLAAKYNEEPFYMIGRDTVYEQGENRTSLHDLAKFEMEKTRSVAADGTPNVPPGYERFPCPAAKKLKSQLEAGMVEKVLGDVKPEGLLATPKAADSGVFKKTNGPRMSELFCSYVSNLMLKKSHSGEMMDVIKPEPVVVHGTVFGQEKFSQGKGCGTSSGVKRNENKVVKNEPADSAGLTDGANPSSLAVITSEAFVELQKPLPSITFTSKRQKTKLIYLRDGNGRAWPVQYHEKYGKSVLATGWKAFCLASSFEPRGKCVFVLENQYQRIFKVRMD